MFLPELHTLRQHRVTVNRFGGYDGRERPEAGSFAGMRNLCADAYPAMTVRPPRALAGKLQKPNGLAVKEALVWVDGQTLYINGKKAGPVLTDGRKSLLSMGAYLLIWPDKVWINTRDVSQFGTLENTTVSAAKTEFFLCRPDGTVWEGYLTAQESPKEPEAGALWLDISGEKVVLRQYVDSLWTEVENVCVKLQCAGIGVGFQAGDGVVLSGCRKAALNGTFVLQQATDDALVISACIAGETSQTEPVTVKRSVPEMDFVVECGNRLWGCKYGIVEGKAVNEIYASKLGDFKNWTCYAGLSTDSYAVARGSDGPFTGAVAYLGSPIFFREQCMERVYPSATGAHRVVTVECPGVKQGSHGSVAVVDGTLYYHGLGGVYAFDGSMPQLVSCVLGQEHFSEAVGGGREGRYYLSAQGQDGTWRLLVYDTARGLWHREDDLKAVAFARRGEELFCLTESGELWAMRGSEGEKEKRICWEAQSGELGLDTAESKYPARLCLRLELAKGSRAEAALSYDGGRTWETQGAVYGQGSVQACLLHLRPRRAPHLRVRLQGMGPCTMYSISAVYEKGSDGP